MIFVKALRVNGCKILNSASAGELAFGMDVNFNTVITSLDFSQFL
jgi:hypothetical protein